MIVIFDLNGTLTDPAGIGEPWGTPELGAEVLQTAIQYAMVDTILGAYRDFSEHVASALKMHVARRSLDGAHIDDALARARRLDPFPDAAAALELLRTAGNRLAVLTNSGAASGRAMLEACGLAGHFEAILGVDAVQRFKPHPATYRYALDALGANARHTFMVAAHAWDVAGALHAGLQGAWIAHDERAYPELGIKPAVTGETLMEVAAAIAELNPPTVD